MSNLDQAAQRTGGRYCKLLNVGDQLVGTLLNIDTEKVRTDPKGNIVESKKTGQARKVFGLLVQINDSEREDDEDDCKRRWDGNESAQYAIIDAFKEWRKENPTGEPTGCEFYIRVIEDRAGGWDQLKYKAKFGKRVLSETSAMDAASAAAPAGPAYDEEPF